MILFLYVAFYELFKEAIEIQMIIDYYLKDKQQL